MRLQGIKIRLTIIICSLLLMSMLLVNFVLIILWQRDALQREVERDQVVLARILDRLPDKISTLNDLSSNMFSFTDFYPGEEKGLILVSTEKQISAPSSPDYFTSLLISAISETMKTGQHVAHYSGSFLGSISFRTPVLVNTQPIVHKGKIVGGAGIARSLVPMFQDLWRVEKIILVYILINLLVFSVIGFFRMVKVVVKPIGRLVWLADRYTDKKSVLFAADSQGGEFGKLANSLNSMLARIEQDRKILEETVAELEVANRKLKTQQRNMIRTEKLASVGRMAAGLAHEIGNPLGIVQGYIGLLARSKGYNDAQYEFISRADQELQRVNELIRQMLDFARVSKGDPEIVSLHDLLRSVVDMIQVQPVFNNIKLTCRLGADRDTVYADQDKLRQVFVNCLLNSADAVIAAEFEEEGVIAVSTDVHGAQLEEDQTEFLRIRISDNGIGITEEQLAVIFDPFYTTKEPGKGTGLGLSVSLSIIESIGGRIEIESKEGQGSVLTVFLPITGYDNV